MQTTYTNKQLMHSRCLVEAFAPNLDALLQNTNALIAPSGKVFTVYATSWESRAGFFRGSKREIEIQLLVVTGHERQFQVDLDLGTKFQDYAHPTSSSVASAVLYLAGVSAGYTYKTKVTDCPTEFD